MVGVHAASDRTILVDEGVIDDRSVLAFTQGQCHGLALAIAGLKHWDLVGKFAEDGTCEHILVRMPEGQLIDITGVRTEAELTESGGTLAPIDQAAIHDLEVHHGWAVADPIAIGWVNAVVEQASTGASTPGAGWLCVTHTLEGFDITVRWGGDITAEVFVRRAGSTEPWAVYTAIRLRRGPDERTTIDYTTEYLRSQIVGPFLERHFSPDKAAEVIVDPARRAH